MVAVGRQALDRFVGRVTRPHGDIDVSVDLANVLPLLAPDEREWLRDAIARVHSTSPWRSRIERA
jgi:hypothetical protein